MCDCRLFARLQEMISTTDDPQIKFVLHQIDRSLRKVLEDFNKYEELLEQFMDTPEAEWEAMLASGRFLLTPD